MNPRLFKVGGALTEGDTEFYIERECDHEALMHLRAMNYLLLIEPRQQGKTSLINRLKWMLALDGVILVYVDVTIFGHLSEVEWYQILCERVLRQISFISFDKWPDIPQNSYQWRSFVSKIALSALERSQQIIIALDEIGAVGFTGATDFFSALRDIFNSRQSEKEFKNITFVLVGAFHPRDLIRDERISPFNIAHRVRLQDFRRSQIHELILKLKFVNLTESGLTEDEILDRIYYWTDGQPYLTQWLCQYISSKLPHVSITEIDDGVEQLRRDDENHLPPLIYKLGSDTTLREYIIKILGGERIKFYPRENRKQAQLELLGLIKPDAEGYCRLRNRIYEQAIQAFLSQQPIPMDETGTADTTILSQPLHTPSHQGAQYVININQSDGLIIIPETIREQNISGGNLSENKLDEWVNKLAKTMQVGFADLKRGQATIYRLISGTNHDLMFQVLEFVHQGRLEQGEIIRTLDAIRRVLRFLQTHDSKLSGEILAAIDDLRQQLPEKTNVGLQQKLELTLPIVPMFLDYKVELSGSSDEELHKLRDEIQDKWNSLVKRSS